MGKNKNAETTKEIKVNNMVCTSCEKIIEKEIAKMEGVRSVKANYSTGKTIISYDPKKVTLESIKIAIKDAGYKTEDEIMYYRSKTTYIFLGVALLIILIGGYFLASNTLGLLNISIPELDATTSVALIFVVGLLTGFHCIGMCGSFVLSYTAKSKQENPSSLNLFSHAQYAIGKLVSYALIGGIFGLIGSIFVFSPELRSGIAIFAGAFLILFGLKLLNIFPILRKLSLPQGLFNKFRIGPLKRNNNPLAIGLLNGLFIACGPLQAMYILATTTGSFFGGATLLLAFGIGTLIPMLGFGVFASFISHTMKNNIVRISAVIVLIMGILMINNGLILAGSSFNLNNINVYASTNENNALQTLKTLSDNNVTYQVIEMDVLASGWSPNSFILKKGVPVKWIINGKEITSCNNAISVPAYNLNFSIKKGTQTIEFTPTKEGVIQWSCWMGMIPGTFIVKTDVALDASGKVTVDAQTQQEINQEIASAPKPAGGCGCGGSGGASTCSA